MSAPTTTSKAIEAALMERPGEMIETPALIRRVYGTADPGDLLAFRQALLRLRKRRPDLEIESVTGYRTRRRPTP